LADKWYKTAEKPTPTEEPEEDAKLHTVRKKKK
jgi:hypothetical protein